MSTLRRIAIGADHGGYEMKEALAAWLKGLGHRVQDCGTHSKDPVDYPRIASSVARQVSSGQCDIGIMIDGAGIGSAMAANKIPGVRAAACYNEALARNCREHNGANVLTLGAGQNSLEQVKAITDIFINTECTAERHLKRVQMIADLEKSWAAGPARNEKENALDISPEDIAKITQRVREMMSGGAAATAPADKPVKLGPKELAQMIDHTILKPDASTADVKKLCDEALKYGFFSVCVNSGYVKQAVALLRGSPVKVCSVVGFPLGAQPPEIKAMEARRAIREGAKEIDMVINIGALKSGDDVLALKDIRAVVETCKESRVLCKVILETVLLTNDEKVRACEMSMKARADFVKTSTGFSSGGATAEDIALMAKTVAPKKLGVKASGGVRTYADAMKMIRAGATRIGSSNSIKMLEEAAAAQ
ncbi:MAG: deoxyribose-phosphate aldolase [Verrucomicrobia bacterium]|nr:deoxyribose-phosphate aldolase [Verrucomicrobiota bacterium]